MEYELGKNNKREMVWNLKTKNKLYGYQTKETQRTYLVI